jgi:hypothetical protein
LITDLPGAIATLQQAFRKFGTMGGKPSSHSFSLISQATYPCDDVSKEKFMKHILAGLAAFTLSLASANADPTTPKAPTQRDWENHLSTRLAVENPELRPTLV